MKILVDTANIEDIRTACSWGIVDGVTTNPSLVARENRPFEEVVKEICDICPGPVSAEVVSLQAEGMIEEARKVSSWAPNIAVKIPMIREGIKAISVLSSEGIKTNCTLCFSPNQALLAAKVGATFISPFIGRLDDLGHRGMELVEEIAQIYANYGFATEIIVASVRHPQHVVEAALIGADICTIPFAVLEKMFKHTLTDVGVERFLADWNKAGLSL